METKMNNFKYDYPKLPLIIIFFAGIPYAIVIKSQTLYKFQDLGSANMILVTVLFFWCFLYWAFVDSTFNLINIFRNKWKFLQKIKLVPDILPKNIFLEDIQNEYNRVQNFDFKANVSNYIDFKRENIETIETKPIIYNEKNKDYLIVKSSINNSFSSLIKPKLLNHINELTTKIESKTDKNKLEYFLAYSCITFCNHFEEKEIKELLNYVTIYAAGNQLSIEINKLDSKKSLQLLDFQHFGWNIANHFGHPKKNVYDWLINVFTGLQSYNVKTISSKLKENPKKGSITIQEDIYKYLEDIKTII